MKHPEPGWYTKTGWTRNHFVERFRYYTSEGLYGYTLCSKTVLPHHLMFTEAQPQKTKCQKCLQKLALFGDPKPVTKEITKDYKDTVIKRIIEEPDFKYALIEEAITCIKDGENSIAVSVLTDILKAKEKSEAPVS